MLQVIDSKAIRSLGVSFEEYVQQRKRIAN